MDFISMICLSMFAISRFLQTQVVNSIRMSSRKRKMATDKTANSPTSQIVWVDLEMTGLDIEKERIIEMACIITDGELNVIAESEDLVIHQPSSILDDMGEWCTKHHGQSGLTEAVRNSKIMEHEAEQQMCEFVKKHKAEGCPLAGNSIHSDRLFLNKYMPTFLGLLHYRIIDVSTIKELNKRWYPETVKDVPKKNLTHRAMDDIRESIEELKYYRNTIFK